MQKIVTKYYLFMYALFFSIIFLSNTQPAQKNIAITYKVSFSSATKFTPVFIDSLVNVFYFDWKKRFIKSTPNDYFDYVYTRDSIKKNKNQAQSLSEGQGYGMLIISLMAKIDPQAHRIYDGLLEYVQAHPSKRSKFLMAWKQNEDFVDTEDDSATDGDLDIAYSLLLADKQWGSNGEYNYLEIAKKRISAIRSQEINNEIFTVLKGNAVEGGIDGSEDYYDMRSSDFMPSHFRAFYNLTHDSIWLRVINKGYETFNAVENEFSGVGLIPDFIVNIKNHPAPAKPKGLWKPYEESKHDGDFYNNACRVPWRLALDYLFFSNENAKNFLSKTNDWIKKTTKNDPLKIAPGNFLNGKPFSKPDEERFDAMSFASGFAVSAIIDKKNQSWENSILKLLILHNINEFNYFDNTNKLICLIILSGKYWIPN